MSYLRSSLLVACSLLAMIVSQRALASYHVATDISYSTESWTLSGYSETWKDPWEPTVDYYCGAWTWDDVYGVVCSAYVTQVFWASVYADLYTPSSALYHSAYVYDLYDANASYAFSITTEPGVWTGQGQHNAEQEFYVSYCFINFCLPPVYSGTYISDLGTSAAQATAYYLVEIEEDHD